MTTAAETTDEEIVVDSVATEIMNAVVAVAADGVAAVEEDPAADGLVAVLGISKPLVAEVVDTAAIGVKAVDSGNTVVAAEVANKAMEEDTVVVKVVGEDHGIIMVNMDPIRIGIVM